MRPHRRIVPAVILAGLLGACQATAPEPPGAFLAEHKLPPPTETSVTVCHGYNCRYRSAVEISAADLKQIGAMFAAAPGTPAGERQAASEAVGWMERKVGALVGTADNPGGSLDNDSIGDPSRQDCVDEAATTTGYLMMFAANGLLAHHDVARPRVRGIFIDGRWQHFTAVLRETESGSEWAVDSWFRPNGQPAVVMTLDDWLLDYSGTEAKQLPAAG